MRPTIEHLVAQKVGVSLSWEFVFVDNNSTDGSAGYVQALWKELGTAVPLRIVKETHPGLVYARIAGVNAAKGKYIVFCDDDNWLCDTYIQHSYDVLSNNQTYGAIGGRGIGVADVILPTEWQKWENDYACGSIAEHSCVVDDVRSPFGAGLATRADVLQLVFSVPFLSEGRKGQCLSSGDDTEICDRILMLGYHLYYDEQLYFWHYMPEERLTEEYHERMVKGFETMYPLQRKYGACILYSKYSTIQKINEFFHRIGSLLRRMFNLTSVQKMYNFIVFGMGWVIFADKERKAIYDVYVKLKDLRFNNEEVINHNN